MNAVGFLGLLMITLGGLAVASEGTFSPHLDPDVASDFTVSPIAAGGQSPFSVPPALIMSGLLGGLVLVIAGNRR